MLKAGQQPVTIKLNGYSVPQPSGAVHSTTNYGEFTFSEANRPIDKAFLAKLTESIRQRNLLHRFPILVSPGMTVIDGQHRLKAAEALGVPVHYIVADEMAILDIAQINSISHKWTTRDHLNFWAAMGRKPYIEFRKFLEHYPWMPISVALQYGAEGKTIRRANVFAEGSFTFSKAESLDRLARAVLDFKPYIGHWSQTAFVRAVANLLSNPEYDHQRMISKLAYLSTRLVKCPTVEAYLQVMTEIYNYKVRAGNEVDLAANFRRVR